MNDEALAHMEAGCDHMEKSRFKSALREFEQAKSLAPDDAVPYCYLGYVHSALNNNKEALREFEQAARLDPDDAWTYMAMGNAQLEQGSLPAATELLNMASELPGEPGVRLLARGSLAYHNKKYPEALGYFRAAAEWIMDWPGLAEWTALTLYRLKRNSESCEVLRNAAKSPAATASTLRDLGMAEKRLRNHKAAGEAYERAYNAYQERLQDNPNDEEALLQLAGLSVYFRRWRIAWKYLQRAIKGQPEPE